MSLQSVHLMFLWMSLVTAVMSTLLEIKILICFSFFLLVVPTNGLSVLFIFVKKQSCSTHPLHCFLFYYFLPWFVLFLCKYYICVWFILVLLEHGDTPFRYVFEIFFDVYLPSVFQWVMWFLSFLNSKSFTFIFWFFLKSLCSFGT